MRKFLLLLILGSSLSLSAQTNNVGIGTNSPDASAKLEVSSTDQGFLIPRLSKTQRNAITIPATSLMIYQTDSTPGFYYYDGVNWRKIGDDLGSHLATQVLDMDTNRIVNVPTPVNGLDAVNKAYVDALIGGGGSGNYKRIFISSSTHTPDFGGLAAGDSICQGLADAQGLGGTWNALLSTSVVDAKDRFGGSYEYRNMVGSLVSSNSFQDVWDHPSTYAIFRKVEYLENGIKAPGNNPKVWTGTNSSGTIWNGTCNQKGGSCNDWTYTGAQNECCCTPCNTGTFCGKYGYGDSRATDWAAGPDEGCFLSNHLYCFEK